MMYGQSMLYANLKGFFLQESKIFFFKDTFHTQEKKWNCNMCVEECRKEEVIKIRREKTQFLLTTSTTHNKICFAVWQQHYFELLLSKLKFSEREKKELVVQGFFLFKKMPSKLFRKAIQLRVLLSSKKKKIRKRVTHIYPDLKSFGTKW